MKNTYKLLLLFIFFNSILFAQNTYFVIKNGSGDFRTISEINSAKLNSGDVVSFKSGESFSDEVLVCQKGITYNTYGGSAKAIIGNSSTNSFSETIKIDNEGVNLENLKIYGYSNASYVISFSKGNWSLKYCDIIGGKNAHAVKTIGINQSKTGYNICENVTIEHNIIRDFRTGIVISHPRNVSIGYNEAFNFWEEDGGSNQGGAFLRYRTKSDLSVHADTYDAEYTLRIHHNNIYNFEMMAFNEGVSRTLYEYNEIHHNLDERIYRGGVKHGTIGKIYDRADFKTGQLGSIFRYNYVHDLDRRGEAGYIYGEQTVEQIRAETFTVISSTNDWHKPIYLGSGNKKYSPHYGDDADEWPDPIISGQGYSNMWIHNNIFANVDNVIFNRNRTETADGELDVFENGYLSYFINNTVFNNRGSYTTPSDGMVGSQSTAQSPSVVVNNIFNFIQSETRTAGRFKEEKLYLDYNLYTNQDSIVTSTSSVGANRAAYVDKGNLASGKGQQYLANPGWIDASSTFYASNIGVNGVYLPDIRISSSRGSAHSKGLDYDLIGDTYTVLGQKHRKGQDPTGRSFAYDILGNLRTTNDIGALGSGVDVTLLIVQLESAYQNENMKTNLSSSKIFPMVQPYNLAPWNYKGNEIISVIKDNYVDWILIELRENINDVRYRKAAILNKFGKVLNPDGSDFYFQNINSANYYLVVKHRNHLSIMSNDKILIRNGETINYDFSLSATKTFGEASQVLLSNNKYGMISGDADGNGKINNLDYGEIANNIFLSGYLRGDLDMNGTINVLDYSKIYANILKKSYVP
jgi:hypothetical protein